MTLQRVLVYQTKVGVLPVLGHKELSSTSAARQKQSVCFICLTPTETHRHLLNTCHTYKSMKMQERKESIIKAGHCINCLSKHHVSDCRLQCKCKHCDKHNYKGILLLCTNFTRSSLQLGSMLGPLTAPL